MSGEQRWFYHDGGPKGPLHTTQLVEALLAMPNPRGIKVWREGLSEWVDAGAAVEIAGQLPPPAPGSSSHAEPPPEVRDDVVRTVAQRYRSLVLLVGVQLLLAVPYLTVSGLGSIIQLPLLLVNIAMAVFAYKLMAGLQSESPILWAIGIFVPLVNLFVLARISSRAQSWCKRHGIKVGFLGPAMTRQNDMR